MLALFFWRAFFVSLKHSSYNFFSQFTFKVRIQTFQLSIFTFTQNTTEHHEQKVFALDFSPLLHRGHRF